MRESFAGFYDDLRRLAHARLRRSEPITLLDTTSLVHESYLKLLQAGNVAISERSQFLAYASHAMRSIIIDFVRRRRAERRGGANPHVSLDNPDKDNADRANADKVQTAEEEIVRVNDALSELAKVDERLVKVVEMRYFAGLSEPEIAEALGITDRTVRRDWKKARLILAIALQ
jgi:RNA polymerase sigma factor (TIGR02999 family)